MKDITPKIIVDYVLLYGCKAEKLLEYFLDRFVPPRYTQDEEVKMVSI